MVSAYVRANPHVELKQLADLNAEQREALSELANDPQFSGILVARPPFAMNAKSVSSEVAELFGSMPAEIELSEDVIDLVLDGVLEIESDHGFVCGADALPILCAPSTTSTNELSGDALLHAQDLETNDPRALMMALYLYNRIPISAFWKTRFTNRDAVLAHVGADRGSLRALLDREWIAGASTTWLSWSSRTPTQRTRDDVTYKLYVSPRPERMRDAFEIVVRVLAGFPGTPFKIGDGAAGLLRPDKLVAYFPTRERLDEAAEALHRELAGCDAHGVPFTAALDATGLLSWGIDPPESDRVLRWTGPRSWRLWVAQKLGAAMAIAKSTSRATAIEPWQFAIARARRHGIDVDTWTPSASLWSAS